MGGNERFYSLQRPPLQTPEVHWLLNSQKDPLARFNWDSRMQAPIGPTSRTYRIMGSFEQQTPVSLKVVVDAVAPGMGEHHWVGLQPPPPLHMAPVPEPCEVVPVGVVVVGVVDLQIPLKFPAGLGPTQEDPDLHGQAYPEAPGCMVPQAYPSGTVPHALKLHPKSSFGSPGVQVRLVSQPVAGL